MYLYAVLMSVFFVCQSMNAATAPAPVQVDVISASPAEREIIREVLRRITTNEGDRAELIGFYGVNGCHNVKDTSVENRTAGIATLCASADRFSLSIDKEFQNFFWKYFSEEFGLFLGFPKAERVADADEGTIKASPIEANLFKKAFLENFIAASFFHRRVRVIDRSAGAGAPVAAAGAAGGDAPAIVGPQAAPGAGDAVFDENRFKDIYLWIPGPEIPRDGSVVWGIMCRVCEVVENGARRFVLAPEMFLSEHLLDGMTWLVEYDVFAADEARPYAKFSGSFPPPSRYFYIPFNNRDDSWKSPLGLWTRMVGDVTPDTIADHRENTADEYDVLSAGSLGSYVGFGFFGGVKDKIIKYGALSDHARKDYDKDLQKKGFDFFINISGHAKDQLKKRFGFEAENFSKMTRCIREGKRVMLPALGRASDKVSFRGCLVVPEKHAAILFASTDVSDVGKGVTAPTVLHTYMFDKYLPFMPYRSQWAYYFFRGLGSTSVAPSDGRIDAFDLVNTKYDKGEKPAVMNKTLRNGCLQHRPLFTSEVEVVPVVGVSESKTADHDDDESEAEEKSPVGGVIESKGGEDDDG